MITEPIKAGQRYRTRSGKVVTVTSETKWNTPSQGSNGAVFFLWNGDTQCVYRDGSNAGKTDPNKKYAFDLVELLEAHRVSAQLDLFDF